MLNKPTGVVTTRSDERGRRTVFDLLAGADLPHLGAVGRLDLESEGLLLFTNDTRWADRIAAPTEHVDKTYHVAVPGLPDAEALQRMRDGVSDRGEILTAKRASVLEVTDDGVWLEIVLDEGKNRQIRRMLSALGVRVLRLKRVAIGSVTLGRLKPGTFRMLTPAEVKALTR
jgi:23S rRNA pseudouridine2605 synthase